MDKYPKYISEQQQELFESYLMEEMSAQEQQSFEANLIDNLDLQKSFNEFKSLFETVEEVGLKSKLDGFHNTIEEKTPVRQLNPLKNRFNYPVAASIVILMSIGGFWWINRPSTNEKLFNQYYTQDPGLPTVMGNNDNYDFFEAMVDYKQGNYDLAINKWEKLLAKKPENDTLNYFLGVSHLATGEDTNAILFLKKVVNSNSYFEKEARHYLGLTHLKNGEVDKAKIFLKENSEIMNKILKQ